MTARPRRAPGTTNAPGGRWHSTSNELRHSKAYRVTLPDRARAAQQAIADARHGGNLSEATAAALLAYAEALGLVTDGQD